MDSSSRSCSIPEWLISKSSDKEADEIIKDVAIDVLAYAAPAKVKNLTKQLILYELISSASEILLLALHQLLQHKSTDLPNFGTRIRNGIKISTQENFIPNNLKTYV